MEKRGKVFIPQEPMKRDRITGEMMPVMDFRKALEYGELVVCLQGGRIALSTAPMVRQLEEVLRDFCDDDYLLAAGNPTAIAVAGAIVARNNLGRFKMLNWDKESKQYIKIEVNLNPRKD
mgnify:CR=1 FL=1